VYCFVRVSLAHSVLVVVVELGLCCPHVVVFFLVIGVVCRVCCLFCFVMSENIVVNCASCPGVVFSCFRHVCIMFQLCWLLLVYRGMLFLPFSVLNLRVVLVVVRLGPSYTMTF
jgi:hypothetical protein